LWSRTPTNVCNLYSCESLFPVFHT
jgi:hypothetical protein